MSNAFGILYSIVLVIFVIFVSVVLKEKFHISEENSRKVVHIGVANFWLIAMYFFTNPFWASVVPLLFVFINTISYHYSVISSMERKNKSLHDLGTIYYPISLVMLALISFSSWSQPYVGGLGILVMGYGDGLAAVVGKKWGTRRIPFVQKNKTVVGTLVMFTISFIVVATMLYFYRPDQMWSVSLVLAFLATCLELYTPYGMDNLTVPLGISLCYQFFFF